MLRDFADRRFVVESFSIIINHLDHAGFWTHIGVLPLKITYTIDSPDFDIDRALLHLGELCRTLLWYSCKYESTRSAIQIGLDVHRIKAERHRQSIKDDVIFVFNTLIDKRKFGHHT